MKSQIGSFVALAIALMLSVGCASIHTTAAKLPATNSVCIDNSRTHYTLEVYQNGKPWTRMVKDEKGEYPFIVIIPPGKIVPFGNCSAAGSENVTLEFRAVKREQSCTPFVTTIGTPHAVNVTLGTDVPGKNIVLHSYDF